MRIAHRAANAENVSTGQNIADLADDDEGLRTRLGLLFVQAQHVAQADQRQETVAQAQEGRARPGFGRQNPSA